MEISVDLKGLNIIQSCVYFQVIADIFNRPVYTIDVPNSSPLGGCYRAKLGTNNRAVTCDFKQCGILTSVDSDLPVQSPFKLRSSK